MKADYSEIESFNCCRATYGQKGLWLTQKLHPESCAYNVTRAFRLSGNVNSIHVKNTLIKLLARHPVLTTVFDTEQDTLLQKVIPFPDFFQEIDADLWTEHEINLFYQQKASIPFNLEKGPLFKAFLLIQRSQVILVLIIHHIVIDLWSELILSKEFLEIYRSEAAGDMPKLSTHKASYRIYAQEEKENISGALLDTHIQFWKEQFKEEPAPLSLPMARQRPPFQTFAGEELNFSICENEVASIKALAAQNGTTVYTFLLSIFHVLILRLTGQNELIVGSTTAGRSHAKYKDIVGYFINPIPIKLYSQRTISFLDLLKKNGEIVETSIKHRHLPLSILLENLSIKRDPSYHPLFQVMFNYVGKLPFWQSKQEIETSLGQKTTMEPLKFENKTAQFDLVINIAINGKTLNFTWEYNTDLFAKDDMVRLSRRYLDILKHFLLNPNGNLLEIDLLQEEERTQIVTLSRGKKIETSSIPTLFHLFEKQSLKAPSAIAIKISSKEVSYRELLKKVHQMSSFLISQGVQPGHVVGLILPKSVEVIVAIFAILKIGAVFLPIDTQYPSDRIQYMLKDSLAWALTDESHQHLVGAYPGVLILNQSQARNVSNFKPFQLTGLAYIIYTSGSTGAPKGVMISHQSIKNYIEWAIRTYSSDATTEFPLFSSLAFDLTLTSIFVPLLSGRVLHIYTHENASDNLIALLKEKEVKTCKLTPSHLAVLKELLQEQNMCFPPRRFVVGGENFNSSIAQALDLKLQGFSLFYNEYGPTEATVGCMVHLYNHLSDMRTSVPIGHPIDNMDIYILNDQLQLVPFHVSGELYISGEGLAWGYLNRPDLTAEKFIPHPFKDGERMYKTGDLAQRLADGTIEYLGRLDHQVKIRGFRIELGEIEYHLRLLPEVKEALVIEKNAKLSAFIIPNHKEASINSEALKASLARNLPSYMIPDIIISLDQFPLNSNGKIDRAQLSIHHTATSKSHEYCPPEGKNEATVTKVWADILELKEEAIGVNDSFFELGGDSIKAIQITSRLRQKGLKCDIHDLFLFPTVRSLAIHIKSASSEKIPSQYANRRPFKQEEKIDNLVFQKYGGNIETIYPLTPIQEGILFHTSIETSTQIYFEQMSCKLEGVIDENYFKQALKFLKNRHELLRATFHTDERGEVKCIVLKEQPSDFIYQDLSFYPPVEQKNMFDLFIQKDREKTFDLFKDSLFRVAVFKLSNEEAYLLWSAHHILLDGWCLGVISRDFSTYYRSLCSSHSTLDLPAVGNYGEYIDWYSTQNHELALNYWKKYLNNYEGPTSPLGIPSTTLEYNRREYGFSLPASFLKPIQSMATIQGVTLNTLFQAVWSVLLYKWTGKKDVNFGTVMAIRPPGIEGIEHMVGLFINTLPVRVFLDERTSWKDLFQQVQQAWIHAQKFAFSSLREIQKLVSDTGQLVDHLFVFGNYPFERGFNDSSSIPKVMMKEFSVFEQTNYSFNAYFSPIQNQGLEVRFVYNGSVFTEKAIQQMHESFVVVLQRMLESPYRAVVGIPYITTKVTKQIFQYSQGPILSLSPSPLIELFTKQASLTPLSIALIEGEQVYSYSELDHRTNQLAHFLRKKGLGFNSLVAVYSERSIEMVCSILAILKAGGAYLPLDITAPKERIQTILRESQCQWMISENFLDKPLGVEIISPNATLWKNEPSIALPFFTSAHDLAYVLFTSGSTGLPKGVMIEQYGVVNLLESLQTMYPLEKEDAFLFKTAYTFDVSCVELFGWFIGGSKLVILSKDAEKDPFQIADVIEAQNITHINFVPSMLKLFLDLLPHERIRGVLQQLKYVFSAGEALSSELIQLFYRFNPRARLVNLYGPTEASVYSTGYIPSGEETKSVPIGNPIHNMMAYVLDKNLDLVPPGIHGDLYLGGPGLARGYLNQPGLTAEKFIPSPFQPSERLYYTGDIARWNFEGQLEFIGRQDDQLKIRGFRIELGEIEYHLRASGLVKQVVAIASEVNQEKMICAYFVPYHQDHSIEEKLREAIKEKVPFYMVPSFFIALEHIPLNNSGKINKSQLPFPKDSIKSRKANFLLSKSDEFTERLLDLWTSVLEISKKDMDTNANFFEQGGHSIKAMMLLSRIQQEWGYSPSIKEFFDAPTFEFLIQNIQKTQKKNISVEIPKVEHLKHFPLTPAQKRLFVLHQLFPRRLSYHMPGAFIIEGTPSVEKLRATLSQLIERHEILKTRFCVIEEVPVQEIVEGVSVYLEEKHCIGKTIEEVLDTVAIPFVLENPPLLYCVLAQIEKQKFLLFLDIHHIIADGISLSLLIEDFINLYEGKTLPQLPLSYKDYACWLDTFSQSSNFEKQRLFWQHYLKGDLPILQMPTDFIRPTELSLAGERYTIKWKGLIVEQLRQLALEEKATMNIVILSILNVLVYKYTEQEDLLIGMPSSARHFHPDLNKIIGMFVNTLVLRSQPKGTLSFIQFLREVRAGCLDIYANQDYPFERMVEDAATPREINRNPLFDIFFAYQNIPALELSLESLTITPLPFDPKEVKFDLSFEIFENESQLIFHVDYSTQLYRKETIERLMQHLQNIAKSVLEDRNCRLLDIIILNQEERDNLLINFNQTAADYPSEKTILDLFEEQLTRTPDHIAVRTENETLTYKQFAQEISLFAADLKKRGVKRGDIVALMTERSLEMLIGIYAILTIGAAYLPIDPSFPLTRKAMLLQASQPHLILVQNKEIPIPISFQKKTVLLQRYHELNPSFEKIGDRNPNDLAYVLFTSGSTGEPKGVLISHRAIVNRLHWMQHAYPISSQDRILQKTPITFDVSVWELFWWVFTGASVYLLETGGEKDPQKIIRSLDQEMITILHFVPSMLNAFLDYLLAEDLPYLPKLTRVFVSGEALQPTQVRKFYQCFPQASLINLYGPTEATVDVSHFPCLKEISYQKIPIGKPIQNLSLYILDSFGKPKPIGILGELYIGGEGLAWGYLGKPDLTAEKFVPHPFKSGERLYRTGDLARWLPEGEIEFLGRIDHQVKIRGMRIELDEIEAAFLSIPEVNQVVIMAQPTNSGANQLYAYITLHTLHSKTPKELKSSLQEKLPIYMIPTEIIILEKFPLTSSGKVDRKQLPEPVSLSSDSSSVVLSSKILPIAEALRSIWEQLLRKSEIGFRDNFFELGGDSILAIQIVAKARSRGIHINLQQLLQLQNIESLSLAINYNSVKVNELADQTAVVGYVPLTPIQHWFFQTIDTDQHHFNQAVLLEVKQPLKLENIQSALQALYHHHDILRAKFFQKEGNWKQFIQERGFPILEHHDLSHLNQEEQKESLQALKERTQKGFILEEGGLLKVCYIHLGGVIRDKMLWVMHHLITDGISWRILLEDFCNIYNTAEQSPQLPFKTVSLKSWVEFLYNRLDNEDYQLGYWLEEGRFNTPPLPIDFQNGSNYVGDALKQTAVLDEELTYDLLIKTPTFYKCEFQEILLAVLGITLNEVFGIEQVVIALEGHGREYGKNEIDLSRTLGWFTSLYPISLSYNSNIDLTEHIRNVQQTLSQVPNKGMDYGIYRYLGKAKEITNTLAKITPQICFNYLGQLDQTLDYLSLFEPVFTNAVGSLHSPRITRPYVLEINFFVVNQKLHIEWCYSSQQYLPATACQLSTIFLDKLKTFIQNTDASFDPTPLAHLSISSKDLDSLLNQI